MKRSEGAEDERNQKKELNQIWWMHIDVLRFQQFVTIYRRIQINEIGMGQDGNEEMISTHSSPYSSFKSSTKSREISSKNKKANLFG